MPLQPVPLEKAYRLINHGPTVMLSANTAATPTYRRLG